MIRIRRVTNGGAYCPSVTALAGPWSEGIDRLIISAEYALKSEVAKSENPLFFE